MSDLPALEVKVAAFETTLRGGSGALDPILLQDIKDRSGTLLERQNNVLATIETQVAKYDEESRDLAGIGRKLQDPNGRLNVARVKEAAARVSQARYQNVLLLLLGRTGSLEQARSISQGNKAALMNAELDMYKDNTIQVIDRLQKQKNDCASEKAQLVQGKNRLQDNLDLLKEEKKKMVADNDNYRKTVAYLKREITTIQGDKTDLEKKLTLAKERKNSLEEANGNLKECLEKTKSRNETLEKEKNELEKSLKLVKADKKVIEKTKTDLEILHEQVQDEKKKLGETNGEQQMQVQALELSKKDVETSLRCSRLKLLLRNGWLQRERNKDTRRLQAAIREKDVLITSRNETIEVISQRVGQATGSIRDKDREILTLSAHVSRLRKDVKTNEDNSTTQRLRAARSFALSYGSHDKPERWLPFVRAFHETDIVLGRILEEEEERPWAMLRPWCGSLTRSPDPAGLQDEGGGDDVIHLLHCMYGAAVSGLPVSGFFQILQRLVEGLSQVREVPLTLVSTTIDAVMDALEDIKSQIPHDHDDILTIRLLAFGLWQLMRLVRARWGGLSATVSRVEDMLRSSELLVGSLFCRFQDGNGGQLGFDFAASRGSNAVDDSMLYVDSLDLGLLKLGSDNHVWIIQPSRRTIRLTYCQNGEWHEGTSTYIIRGFTEKENIILPLDRFSDKAWILKNMWQR